MELTKILMEMQPASLPPFHQLLALVCLVAFIYKVATILVKRNKILQHFKAFPGPPGHWFFGHSLRFEQDERDMEQIVEFGKQFPYAFPIQFSPLVCFLIIHHPDYAKTILATAEPKDDLIYRFVESWGGNGLFVSKGQKWFRHRRLLAPSFNFEVLKPYTRQISETSKILLDKWEKHADTDKAFDISEDMSLLTLDSILQCAFSYKSNCQTDGKTDEYIRAVYTMTDMVNVRLTNFPFHNNFIFNICRGLKYRKANEITHTKTDVVIKKRREDLKDEKELNRIQAKRGLDFLDLILLAKDDNQEPLSDEDIHAEVGSFMIGGHDSTASALQFIFYTLSLNPEHQQKCREEVLKVLDGKDYMDWDDLNNIPYTTMCIKESLRLFPPIPAMSRKITKPITFFDGRTLPAGSFVGTSVFGLHRNATVWENPDVFDPLRFLPENVAKRSPHAFIPFSAGPRNCIGQNFALNEIKVVTAFTLKRYELVAEPSFKPKLIARIVLRSLTGIHIKLRSIKKQK